jgi:peptidase M23-like protein
VSRGRIFRGIALLALLTSACSSAPPASDPNTDVPYPDDRAIRSFAPVDPLRCTDRATIPLIENVTNMKWSPDGQAIAVSRIVIIPSSTAITGYEEQQLLSVFDLRTNTVRDLGEGNRPEWSGSGAYLSYWRNDGYLHIDLDGTDAGAIDTSDPEVRWDGDTLYYWYYDEIRAWHDGVAWTVSHVDPDLAIQYPRDDAYFSADAEKFMITQYSLDGTTERWLGTTSTGATSSIDDPDTTFTEWAPKGHTLLLRSNDRVTLREPDGSGPSAPLSEFAGTVHAWTPDARLLLGGVTPTVPGGNAFDTFTVWDPTAEADHDTATLPNLLGSRAFSPNGLYFAGVSRTGLYSTQLEVYRCGVAAGEGIDVRADPVARSRQARIESDGRRFVRPVAGAVTQWLQGAHTGIDIAAPYGSLIVAADDGVIDAAGWVQVGGRRVCVMHARGIESCYYHTSAALVSIGQRVSRGQPIALIGMTGATTGPHVHWEVKENERIVDPLGL